MHRGGVLTVLAVGDVFDDARSGGREKAVGVAVGIHRDMAATAYRHHIGSAAAGHGTIADGGRLRAGDIAEHANGRPLRGAIGDIARRPERHAAVGRGRRRRSNDGAVHFSCHRVAANSRAVIPLGFAVCTDCGGVGAGLTNGRGGA